MGTVGFGEGLAATGEGKGVAVSADRGGGGVGKGDRPGVVLQADRSRATKAPSLVSCWQERIMSIANLDN
jgi:hypothetical protein